MFAAMLYSRGVATKVELRDEVRKSTRGKTGVMIGSIRSHRRRPRGLPNPALCPAATAAASAQGVGLGHRIARGRSEWGGAWRGVDGEGSDAGWFSACAAGDDMEQRGEDRWSGGG